MKRVAIIGGGVSGIVSAKLLQDQYQVTIFEANSYLGGHTNTVEVKPGVSVDTGFIVLNDQTYPTFTRFLELLDVPIRYSDMSFGFHSKSRKLVYAGTGFNGFFADRLNLLRPKFYQFIFELKRFCKNSLSDLGDDRLLNLSLGEYLSSHKYTQEIIRDYILPIGASIWSTPSDQMLKFPALTFLNFFKNHGLLSLKNRPRWQTVVGGSQEYVKKFKQGFTGTILLDTPVKSVNRGDIGVSVTTNNSEEKFDYVIFALHADQILPILSNPSEDEHDCFSKWQYNYNRTVLHTDLSVLPTNSRAWASWNYNSEESIDGQVLSVTYDMNRLQGLNTQERYLVTLSPNHQIDPAKIIKEYDYYHPLYTNENLSTQSQIKSLNGKSNIFYAGSYLGYGFHEDAVASANSLASYFKVKALR